MTATRKKTGGRKKGTPNKRTQDVLDKLERMGCDPIEGMAKLALGEIDCSHCAASGRVTKAQFFSIVGIKMPEHLVKDEDDDLDRVTSEDVTCPICGGTALEPIQTKIRADMFKELAQYVAPKLKSIEHTGKDGKELPQLNVILNGCKS